MAFVLPSVLPATRHRARRSPQARAAPLRPSHTPQQRVSNQASLTFLPLSPPPTKKTPTTLPQSKPALTRPKRKPHGYWNSFSNLENELIAVNKLLKHPPRTMPSFTDLRGLHRTDITAALSKHGGLKIVAATLRWHRASSTHPRTPTRKRLRRRPNNYWDDSARVVTELQAFIDEFGTRGHMPTRAQFYQVGRSDLVNAAARHGGLTHLAGIMGLCARKSRRKWSGFHDVETLLRRYSENGRMPTARQLHEAGEGSLVYAVVSNGGFRQVAKRLRLRCRGRSRQGAPNVWDEKKLKKEVLAFIMAQYPALARQNVMPSEKMVRSRGRADISYAIGKFGGFKKVAALLGLQTRRASAWKTLESGVTGKDNIVRDE